MPDFRFIPGQVASNGPLEQLLSQSWYDGAYSHTLVEVVINTSPNPAGCWAQAECSCGETARVRLRPRGTYLEAIEEAWDTACSISVLSSAS